MYKARLVVHGNGEDYNTYLLPQSPGKAIPTAVLKDHMVTPPSSPDCASMPLELFVPGKKNKEELEYTCSFCKQAAVARRSMKSDCGDRSVHVFNLCSSHYYVYEEELLEKVSGLVPDTTLVCCNCSVPLDPKETTACTFCGKNIFCGRWCSLLSNYLSNGRATHDCMLPGTKVKLHVPKNGRQRSKSNKL